MENAVAAFKHELSRVRTGRASTALLEGLHVNYYGTKTPLRQLAGLAAPEPRLLVITPYDKGALRTKSKRRSRPPTWDSIRINDGKVIRIPIPELNEERRKDLVRHVRKMAEDFRVSIRNHRRDANDMLKRFAQGKEAGRGRSPRCGNQGPAAHHRVHREARQSARRQRSGDHGGLSRAGRSSIREARRSTVLQQLVAIITPTGRIPRSVA